MDWQKIETAPKDGTVVLTYDPRWQPPLTASFYEFPPGSGAKWRLTWDDTEKYGRHEPTHWMPLPAPPESDVRADDYTSLAREDGGNRARLVLGRQQASGDIYWCPK